MVRLFLCVLLASAGLTACAPQLVSQQANIEASVGPARIDAAAMLGHVRVLAHDSLEGRQTGTEGSAKARGYIIGQFERMGVEAFDGAYLHSFSFTNRRDSTRVAGVNVIARIRGSESPDRYIVITAHYDHLGIRNGEIFNGADDNASGTGALLAMADYFRRHQPKNSIIFAALDAEEMGLQGARAFVANPPVPAAQIVMNINMDMVGRNDRNELYAAGTYHYPFLRPFVEEVQARAPVKLLLGHDQPGLPAGDDWTQSSDHGPFHSAGVPFVYFGVEDHPDYHKATDEFERIQPAFYGRAAETVLDVILGFDRNLGSIAAARAAR